MLKRAILIGPALAWPPERSTMRACHCLHHDELANATASHTLKAPTVTTRAAPVMLGVALLAGTPAGAAGLAGSEWRPIRIGETLWTAGAEAFVHFASEGRLAGHAGCNRFMGSYALAGDSITIGPLAATRMLCPEPVMERERLLLDVLERARTFARNRTELTLADPEGKVTAYFVQTDWD